MKHKNYILASVLVAGLGMGAVSCSDYLDVSHNFKDLQSLERIFSDKDYTMQWLANAYLYLNGDNLDVGHTDCAVTNFSDDQIFNEGTLDSKGGVRYRYYKMGYYDYQGGSWDNWYQGGWPNSYDGIRQVTILLNEVGDNIDLMTPEEVTDIKGQAHFLRGLYYWFLVRRYGPVPIMPIEGADYTKTYEELSYPRNSMDECVDFICSEFLKAAEMLPIARDNANIVRPTRGAALAYRAKVLLYAASPLYNGNTEFADFVDKSGRQLIPQEYDESKWAKAAAAARDVIEYAEATGAYKLYTTARRTVAAESDYAYPLTVEPPYNEVYSNEDFPNGWANIDPFESYRSIFNGELYAADNPELIFTRGYGLMKADFHTDASLADLVRHQMPGNLGGWNIHGMTMQQCNAYDMADGTPFDRSVIEEQYGGQEFTTSDNKDLHPYDNLPNDVWMGYANREPRFYASVAYSGYIWPCTSATADALYQNQQIFYYRGETNGRTNGNERFVPTGIGICKYYHPSDCGVGGGTISQKMDVAMRYADILLMYAEALNNLTSSYQVASWDNTTTYTISRDIEEMRRGVKPVRMRAGVPDYDAAVYADPTRFFEAIVHERQVEFFNENQRFYDLRRWKLAEKYEAAPIMGCNTFMDRNNRSAFYNVVRVPDMQNTFTRKMYFWPIQYDELKRNMNMTQAPGWKDYD